MFGNKGTPVLEPLINPQPPVSSPTLYLEGNGTEIEVEIQSTCQEEFVQGSSSDVNPVSSVPIAPETGDILSKNISLVKPVPVVLNPALTITEGQGQSPDTEAVSESIQLDKGKAPIRSLETVIDLTEDLTPVNESNPKKGYFTINPIKPYDSSLGESVKKLTLSRLLSENIISINLVNTFNLLMPLQKMIYLDYISPVVPSSYLEIYNNFFRDLLSSRTKVDYEYMEKLWKQDPLNKVFLGHIFTPEYFESRNNQYRDGMEIFNVPIYQHGSYSMLEKVRMTSAHLGFYTFKDVNGPHHALKADYIEGNPEGKTAIFKIELPGLMLNQTYSILNKMAADLRYKTETMRFPSSRLDIAYLLKLVQGTLNNLEKAEEILSRQAQKIHKFTPDNYLSIRTYKYYQKLISDVYDIDFDKLTKEIKPDDYNTVFLSETTNALWVIDDRGKLHHINLNSFSKLDRLTSAGPNLSPSYSKLLYGQYGFTASSYKTHGRRGILTYPNMASVQRDIKHNVDVDLFSRAIVDKRINWFKVKNSSIDFKDFILNKKVKYNQITLNFYNPHSITV